MKDINHLSLRIHDGQLYCLDQTQLPHKEIWTSVPSPTKMVEVIQKLQVRGAPLIGVAAALSLGLYALKNEPKENEFRAAAIALREARPTAVNLMIAMDRMLKLVGRPGAEIYAEAFRIYEEDVTLCERMAEFGAALVQDGDQILTHCNTGSLATAGVGTALGVIRKAHEQGKNIHVYVDETRPLLQGARLTTWELEKLKIPYTLICDNMAGFLMAQGKVNKVFVGSDRIACNGDFANKIGTFSVALMSYHHRIPFYVVAPKTTVDVECLSGKGIPIEERDEEEVRHNWSPRNAKVWNPAFDITPKEFVTGWVLDSGVLSQQDVEQGALRNV